MGGGNYGCTKWRCGNLLSVEDNHDSNTLLTSTLRTKFPPKFTSCKHAMLNQQYFILKSDTRAKGNYIYDEDAIILHNLQSTIHGPCVQLPNNWIFNPNKQVNIPLPNLSSQATHAHLLPNLNSTGLLSIGKLCNSDCLALFTKTGVTIFNAKNDPVIIGQRNNPYGLWDVNISSSKQSESFPIPVTPSANAVLFLNKTKSKISAYHHTDAGWTTESTFSLDINDGNFTTFPGHTAQLVSKHLQD